MAKVDKAVPVVEEAGARLERLAALLNDAGKWVGEQAIAARKGQIVDWEKVRNEMARRGYELARAAVTM